MNSQILKSLNQRPIAYYPIYRRLTGSTTGGILLSQIMYWFTKKDKIFKTDREIIEETLLTKKELENAKKLIKNLDFITVSREGIPAKTYYEIDWEIFEKSLTSFSENGETSNTQSGKQVSTKGGNCVPPKGETIIVKSLTETTTETTTDIKKNKKKNKISFPTDDTDLKAYAILQASTKGIKCPIKTYESFRDHHMANGTKFVNWKSAFNTWVTNFFKYESKNEYETILVNNELIGTYDLAEELMNITATKKMMRMSKQYFVDGVVEGTIVLKY